MATIQNVWTGALSNPKYVKPYVMNFTINGHKKKWELVKSHDSVAVLIYNTQKESFVLVRQFRPAVFVKTSEGSTIPHEPETPPINEYSTESGKTWELCAGIIDREVSPVEIAAAEVYEETGYRVTVDQLTRVTMCVNGVGTSGAKQWIYYTEVTNAMQETSGGGLVEEGEFVEVVDLPKADLESFIYDESKPKPSGCVFALLWWLNKYGLHKP